MLKLMICGGNAKMPYGSRYRVQLRRRREKKTDYQARKGFVVSHKPRLVSRSSNKNTVAQIVIAKPQGDLVLASAHSRELIKKYGWKASRGNIPAAYLTGLLCGLKAKKAGISEAILDLGLVSPTKGAKVFSTMSGVVDAGVVIPHDEEKIVKERTRGYHIQDYLDSLGTTEEYAPKFSILIANGVPIAKFADHFTEVRNSILTEFGMPIPKAEPRPPKPKKPEPKKPETKPAKTEPKVEAKKPEVAEVKKPAPPEAKPAEKVEAKPKAVAEPKPEPKVETPKPRTKEAKVKAEEKPKATAKAKKPAAKKAPAKATKAEEAEPEPQAKPKRESKKPSAKDAGVKTAKKTGGKKA
jgi:large subunit ribosomal protein L18